MTRETRNPILAHPIVAYTLVAYAWSWTWWFAARLAFGATPDPGHFIQWATVIVIGLPGPSISALLVTHLIGGRAATFSLVRRLFVWRVAPIWYVVSIAVPVIYDLGGVALFASLGGRVGPFHWPGLGPTLAALGFALPYGPICEELGWRGFALPALQRRHNALFSSIVIGLIWTLWHLPLMWMAAGTMISGKPVTFAAFSLYLASDVGLAIFFTWVANHTRGSVLLAVLIHAGTNAGIGRLFFPGLTTGAYRAANYDQVLTIWIVALVLIGFYGPHLRKASGNSAGV